MTADIAELFAAILDADPDRAALVQDGDVLTFAGWWEESGRAAGVLAGMGVGPGTVVGLLLPSGRSFAVWYLAVLRLGGVVSAVNPRLGPAEIDHILRGSGPVVTITDEPSRIPPTHPSASADLFHQNAVPVDGAFPAAADHPAAIVWTTGTTGLPKGAWFDHGTLRYIGANLGPLTAMHDRKLMPVPFAHSGYVTRIYDQLVHRCTLILTPALWSAREMLRLLEHERVTLGQGVPTQWEKLVALDELDSADLSSLRLIATGASRVSPELVRRLRNRLGCPVVVRYASTEVPLAFGTAPDDAAEIAATTVGRPLGETEVEIRDGDGASLAAGGIGRVFLRSRAAMRGYWGDPVQTAAVMGPDGWLASSDLGRLDSRGDLTIIGRADDAYIRGGYNIYPSEVETALAAHPDVEQVAVVGAPAPVIGEIGVAFVVRTSRGLVTGGELRTWCREQIADYKTPDIVEFVPDLPVNATYKVDVPQLRLRAAELIAGSPPRASAR